MLCRGPLTALVLLPVLLGGCAALPGNAGSPVPPAVLLLEVVAPEPLRALLGNGLSLGRVNRLAQGEALPPGELDRLLASTPQQARELLDTEGYFNAVVTVERMDPASPESAGPPAVRVSVQPGPRTGVGNVDLTLQGPLQAMTEAVTPDGAHARHAAQALRRDWPLPPGTPFRDADWSRAKTASVAGLRAQGWVQADWTASQARIDAATQVADLSATVDSGPLFRIGPLRVRGLRVQDEDTVRNIANLQPGAPATEAVLLDFQERLQKSDLFELATVTLDVAPPLPQATPVVVRLGERKLQEATVGVGVGANVGARATLNHVHRRPFGQPWIARNRFEISQLEQRWMGELSTQTLPRLYRNLVAGGLQRLVSDTDVVNAAQLRLGRAQDTQRIDRLLFAEWNH